MQTLSIQMNHRNFWNLNVFDLIAFKTFKALMICFKGKMTFVTSFLMRYGVWR